MRLPWLNFFKPRPGKPASKRVPVAKAKGEYHAIEIACGIFACEAAEQLRGQRFLSDQAPSLPLKGCDQGQCTCAYAHRADRRAGPRRDADMGLPGFDVPGERRGEQARRVEDGPRREQELSTSYYDYASTTQTGIRRADLQAAGIPARKP